MRRRGNYPKKSVRWLFIMPLALSAVWCRAGESSYYREFLAATSSKRAPFQITSSLLTDTNNCSPTERQRAISLTPGALLGVRLGMSMDEVVSVWGKPLAIGCCRTDRPCFNFEDVWVYFDGNQVSEVGLKLWMPFTPLFSGELVPVSPTREWLRVLGKPTNEYTNVFGRSLCYETNHTVLTLRFDLDDKQLSTVKLTSSSKAETRPTTGGQR